MEVRSFASYELKPERSHMSTFNEKWGNKVMTNKTCIESRSCFFKRSFLGLVTALIVLLALVATQAVAQPYALKPGKPYNGQTITILWHTNEQFKAIERRTQQFTDLTGIKVEYVWVPFPGLHEKLVAELVAGQGTYDAVNVSDYWLPGFSQFFAPLDEFIKDARIDMNRYPPTYRSMGYYKGVLYSMVLRAHAQLLYYRKDIFDKLQLKVPTSWKEVAEAGKKIQEKTKLAGIAMYYGRVSPTAMHNIVNWFPMLWSAGGIIFDENWKPAFNDKTGVEVTQQYVDLHLKQGVTPRGSVAFSEYEAVVTYEQGDAAMYMGLMWSLSVFQNPKLSKPEVVKYTRVAPVPIIEGKSKASLTVGHMFSIPKASKNIDAAKEWLKWVTNPDLEKEYVKAREDVMMVQTANLLDPEINKMYDNFYKTCYETVKDAQTVPLIPEWAEISSYLSIAISEAVGGMPVKTALDRAAKAIEDIMKRAGYYK